MRSIKARSRSEMVADLHAHGNAMKPSDMARYFAAERDPVSSTYRGYTFFSSAPPVSGGAELAAKLNLARAVSDRRKPYRRRRRHAARDDRRVAARAVDAQSHRRPEPLADEHRAVHEQGHGADSLALLRSETRRSAWRRCAATRCAAAHGEEDGEHRAGAAARVHRARLRRQPGRDVPLRGNDGVRRRRRRRQRRGGDADARHVGREFLRDAGIRILLQRQAVVVWHRSDGVRRASAVRATRQHDRADDRVRGQRTIAARRHGASARRATRGSRRPSIRRSSA